MIPNNPDFFRDKKCLITGGLGFIGSNLARALLELGAQITLVDSLIPEYGGNLFNVDGIEPWVRINISDVRDRFSMRALVKDQDLLFNLAGQTSHLDSMHNPYADIEINCHAQISILEACRHYNPEVKIIFASTRQFYGKPDYLPVDEKHPTRPVDVNGINKLAGEWYHILYNNVYGIRACALRLTNTYGPRMRIIDARQTFLGIWVQRAIRGSSFEVWGGDQLRDFTYVDDCVNALLLAAENPAADGKIFNLGGQNPLTLRVLAELLIEENGGRGSFEIREFPAERKKIDIGNYYCDWSLIHETLGWKPEVDEREGLKRTLEFYRENSAQYL